MTGGTRLALFAGAAVLAVAVGAGAGWALPEVRDGAGAGHAHGAGTPAPADEHGAHGDGMATAAPAGLAVTDRGLTLAPERVRLAPGGDRFAFRVVDGGGRAVTDLDLAHERRMHLIVVRRDLGHYVHVHPVMAPDGTWAVDLDLPAGGVYRAYADLSHAGLPTTLGTDLFVDGPLRSRALPAPADTAVGDGYAARVVAREDAGDEVALTYAVTRGGLPANGIQPYLGAAAHVVAVREGDMAFVHAHAEEISPPADRLEAVVHAPSAGRYRVFVQFRHDGLVRTVAHTMEVGR